MSSDIPEPADHQKPRRPFLRRVKVGAVVVVVLFVGVWFLSPAGTVEAPVRLERGADGQLQEVSEPQNSGLHFGGHVASLKATNQTGTGSSTTHPNPAWFRCESILVMNRSDHLLMKRIGEALVEALKQDAHLDRIDYLPHGHLPEPGRLAPDLVVTLRLDSIAESGLVGRDLKAIVLAEIGTEFAAGRRSRNTSLSPPVVTVRADCRVEHESTLLGVESAGTRYTAQGKDIATQIGNAIDSQLESLREKHDPLPELPDAFYPPFRETPRETEEFEFLSNMGAVRQASFHGLMLHNETWWEIDASADSKTTVELIQSELAAAGWTGRSQDDHIEQGFLWMERDARFVHVFRQKWNTWHTDGEAPATPIIIRYMDRMSEGELDNILTAMLNGQHPDLELLLRLREFADLTQRDQILSLSEELPPRSAHAWVALAQLYASRGHEDRIFNCLHRAHALSQAQPHSQDSSTKSQIERLAKKHELDLKQIRELDISTFDELGFIRLDEDNPEAAFEVRGNSPAGFLIHCDDPEKWMLIAVHVRSLSDSRARMIVVDSGPNTGKGSMSQEIDLTRSWEHSHGLRGFTCRILVERNAEGTTVVKVRGSLDSAGPE